jgi:uncharacterized protein YdeI (YjbR/CyaY-like superfamily)
MEIGETLLVHTRQEWRDWLAAHGRTHKEIWLIIYKKSARRSGIAYEDAVLEGLCFGWVDSQSKGMNEESYAMRFTPRRPKSQWTAGNRARAARLLREGLMTEVGLAVLPAEMKDDHTPSS